MQLEDARRRYEADDNAALALAKDIEERRQQLSVAKCVLLWCAGYFLCWVVVVWLVAIVCYCCVLCLCPGWCLGFFPNTSMSQWRDLVLVG
jgi:hypothetical protein